MNFGGEKLRWKEAPRNRPFYFFRLLEFCLILCVELCNVFNTLNLICALNRQYHMYENLIEESNISCPYMYIFILV